MSSGDDPRRFLLAYDVTDDHRRTRLAKLLERYGDRVQYSVFVVQIRPAKMVRLLEDIYITIDTRLDSVLICDLGRAEKRIYSRMTFIGRERPMTPNDVIII
jgi:CRISPR-associated protein Cas2